MFTCSAESNEDLEKLSDEALPEEKMSLIGSSGLLSSKEHSGPA